MADIKNPNLIVIKGLMFLTLGIFASAILIFLMPRLDIIALHCISIWAFCRFYYFTFYVIENYVDDSYKFDGLYAAFSYLLKRYWNNRGKEKSDN